MRLPPDPGGLAPGRHLQVSGLGLRACKAREGHPASAMPRGRDRLPSGTERPVPRGVQAGQCLLVFIVGLGEGRMEGTQIVIQARTWGSWSWSWGMLGPCPHPVAPALWGWPGGSCC